MRWSSESSKAEVTFAKGIEKLLESLTGPLTVVHSVDPTEAAAVFEKWVPPVKKELGTFESASNKVQSDDPEVVSDLKAGKAKIVLMKLVYTILPNHRTTRSSRTGSGSEGRRALWRAGI